MPHDRGGVGRLWRAAGAAVVGFTLAGSGLADAQTVTDLSGLAQDKGCMTCHSVGTDWFAGQGTAPTFSAIAQENAKNPQAIRDLKQAILYGKINRSNPNVFMPGSVNVTPAQALALATWILSLR